MNQGAAPPGWYPDKLGTSLRWWDGQRWTEHYSPTTHPHAGQHPAAARPARRPTPRMRIAAALAIIAAIAAAGWYILAGSTTHTQWYDEGYGLGIKTTLLGDETPKSACDLALIGKIGFNGNPFSRRTKDLKRGCIQGVLDHAKDHKPLPTSVTIIPG